MYSPAPAPTMMPYAPPYYPAALGSTPPGKKSVAKSKRTKVLIGVFALSVIVTIILAGMYLGFIDGNDTDIVISQLRNPSGLFNALPPYIYGGIALLCGLLCSGLLGIALLSRGFLIFSTAVALSGVSYFAPVWNDPGLIVLGAFVQLFCLFTAVAGWRLPEAFEDDRNALGVDLTKGLKVPTLMIAGAVWSVISIIGAIFLLISQYAQAPDTSQVLFDEQRVAITASFQLVAGVLSIFSYLRKFRTGLICSACLGLFVVVLYSSLLPFSGATDGVTEAYCSRSPLYQLCADADWVYVHMVMRWLNWGFAMIFFWFCFYAGERLQTWEDAEIKGIDRNLSDPFSMGCVTIHRPILFYRRILTVLFILWTAFIAAILAINCIADQNVPGIPVPQDSLAYQNAAWTFAIVPMLFSLGGVLLGFFGVAANNRTCLIGSITVQLGFFSAYVLLFLMSVIAAIDGRSTTNLLTLVQFWTPYTGFELAIAVANSVCAGITILILCMSAPFSWLLLEALQDAEWWKMRGPTGPKSHPIVLSSPAMPIPGAYPAVMSPYASAVPYFGGMAPGSPYGQQAYPHPH